LLAIWCTGGNICRGDSGENKYQGPKERGNIVEKCLFLNLNEAACKYFCPFS
jgi:hypothetical protein